MQLATFSGKTERLQIEGRWSNSSWVRNSRGHQAGLGDEPRKIFAELQHIALVDVVMPTRPGTAIRKRCVSRPTEHQAILLQRLGLQLPTNLEMTRV